MLRYNTDATRLDCLDATAEKELHLTREGGGIALLAPTRRYSAEKAKRQNDVLVLGAICQWCGIWRFGCITLCALPIQVYEQAETKSDRLAYTGWITCNKL